MQKVNVFPDSCEEAGQLPKEETRQCVVPICTRLYAQSICAPILLGDL